jgi:ubiquitin C-terminal hydrolase
MLLNSAMKFFNLRWLGPVAFLAGFITLESFPKKNSAFGLISNIASLKTGTNNHSNPTSTSSIESKRPKPVGLINLSNTCYLNAILQSLFNVKQFSSAILLGAYKFTNHSIGYEVRELFKQLNGSSTNSKKKQQNGSSSFRLPISPLDLADKLAIDIRLQEDAEELLLKVINGLDESLLVNKTSSDVETMKLNMKIKRLIDTLPNHLKPSNALRIDMEQSIRCIDLDHISSKKNMTYFDLSLPIQNCRSIYEAFDHYFAPELLTGENQYQCDIHGLQDAEKQQRIVSFPRVLTVHLKRFSFDAKTYQMKKVSKIVFFVVSFSLKYCQ